MGDKRSNSFQKNCFATFRGLGYQMGSLKMCEVGSDAARICESQRVREEKLSFLRLIVVIGRRCVEKEGEGMVEEGDGRSMEVSVWLGSVCRN